LKLGPQAFVMGHNFIHSFDLLQGIKPLIDKTFIEHNITIDSALLYNYTLISLYRREAPNILSFRLPLVMEDL
jgi:IclR family pca regulon transcriptional regulator